MTEKVKEDVVKENKPKETSIKEVTKENKENVVHENPKPYNNKKSKHKNIRRIKKVFSK